MCVRVGSDAARNVQVLIDRLVDEHSLLEELQSALANQSLPEIHAFLGGCGRRCVPVTLSRFVSVLCIGMCRPSH